MALFRIEKTMQVVTASLLSINESGATSDAGLLFNDAQF
jgi:hypothetical protein